MRCSLTIRIAGQMVSCGNCKSAGACHPSRLVPLRSPAAAADADADGKAVKIVICPMSAGILRLPKLQLPLTITTEAPAQPRCLSLSSSLPLLLLERVAPRMLLRSPT